MLPKHIENINTAEIQAWLSTIVTEKREEDIFIDYKATINFEKKEDKLEVAKDLSAFANTEGGALLVGFDEETDGKQKMGIPKNEYGIEKIDDFEVRVSQILEQAVAPNLPRLSIREICVAPGRFIYVVYHPKSFGRPHMVYGYKDKRYYKRDGKRSRPMEFWEVEDLFQEKFRSSMTIEKYLEDAQDGSELIQKPTSPLTFKSFIIPVPIHEGAVDLFGPAGVAFWKDRAFMFGSSGHSDWRPSVGGILLLEYRTNARESAHAVKLHASGGISYTFQDVGGVFSDGRGGLLIPHIIWMAFPKQLRSFLLEHLNRLKYDGDLVIRISTENLRTTLHDGIGTSGSDSSHPEFLRNGNFDIQFVTTSTELRENMENVIDTILNEMGVQMGVWDYAIRIKKNFAGSLDGLGIY